MTNTELAKNVVECQLEIYRAQVALYNAKARMLVLQANLEASQYSMRINEMLAGAVPSAEVQDLDIPELKL